MSTPPPTSIVLTYPQTSIVAAVGTAIQADTPTVTGTVTGFSVAPALPAGLSLNTATGAISGTPTAVTAQASYTVTASNGSGSTGAAVQITVNPTPPSGLTYPQTSIVAAVGTAIQTDTPTVTGTVTGFSVAPALPAGLSLNITTGAISGAPTTVTAQASYTVTASNSSGSTAAAVQITVNPTPPSDLTYPQTSIVATIGFPILNRTPTWSGTVTGFSVAPALPEGISLDTATGTLSGTPTTATAQTSYTVTASNAGGSTTAIVQITVNPAAPYNFSYPQSSISGTTGTAIPTDTPTVSGGVIGYSVAPALPAGLSLNATSGAISGAPTTVTAQANYTVTASNNYGSTTATVSITVTLGATALLDLGHATQITALQETANSVLSVDAIGHWVLWNYASGKMITSGDGAEEIAMAGPTAAIATQAGIVVMSSTSGQVLSTIPLPETLFQLATDGSYIVAAGAQSLTVWSPEGQEVLNVPGAYPMNSLFSSPTQIQVANGPAGANVIQTILVPSGVSSVSPTFSGEFSQWSTDGSHFISSQSNTSWIYSNAAVQQGIMNAILSGGVGNWVWSVSTQLSPTYSSTVSIYAIGSQTPSASYTVDGAGNNFFASEGNAVVFPSGNEVAIIAYGKPQVSVIDLSGSSPVETTYSISPLAYSSAFAAVSASQWVAGNKAGGIIDGASAAIAPAVSATPRLFGYGGVLSMAGSPNMLVASTASGATLFYNLTGPTPTLTSTTQMIAGQMSLSSDSSILGVLAWVPDYDQYSQYIGDASLTFYSLPSMNPLYTYSADPSANEFIYAFAMSGSGTTIAQYLEEAQSTIPYQESVTGISGSPVYLTNNDSSLTLGAFQGAYQIMLSPDGTLIGGAAASKTTGYETQIYKNGTLVAAVPGLEEGWINDDEMLVCDYELIGVTDPSFECVGSTIYSATGETIANSPITLLGENLQFPTAGTVYDQTGNAIASLTTGNPIWQGSKPPDPPAYGVVCGPYICYVSGHQLVIYPY